MTTTMAVEVGTKNSRKIFANVQLLLQKPVIMILGKQTEVHMEDTVYEYQTRVQALADMKSTKLTSYDRREIEHDRWAELEERFRHGQLVNKSWQLWEVETGELSDKELKELEILTEIWERQLGNANAIRKPAIELLKEVRKEMKARSKNAAK